MSRVCRALGKSRAAFHKAEKARRRRGVDEELVLGIVRRTREIHPRAGVKKLVAYLKPGLAKAGAAIGRDRLGALLRKHGMLVEPRRSSAPKTTRFDASLPVATNLVRGLKSSAPNQAHVADITCIRTNEGFLCLPLLADLYSRMIVGSDAGASLETQGCLNTLAMALSAFKDGRSGAIHHSDRGSQYSSHLYRKALEAAGMKCSMTEELHCYENSVAERVNGILKQEYFLDITFETKAEALAAIKQAVYTYNHLRIHESLGCKTPIAVHTAAA